MNESFNEEYDTDRYVEAYYFRALAVLLYNDDEWPLSDKELVKFVKKVNSLRNECIERKIELPPLPQRVAALIALENLQMR